MAHSDTVSWKEFAQAFAFVGNSLLTPMNQTEKVGLDPAFWEAFPDFNSTAVSDALDSLAGWARAQQGASASGSDTVQDVSVEFTRLFIGPPKPAAKPWETFYRAPEGVEVTVGFGSATFEMQQRLRDAGLEVSNANNQYADHMGIELLLLSVLCERVDAPDASAGKGTQREVAAEFAKAHPGAWIGRFREAVDQAAPGGYYARLLALAEALLSALFDCAAI